MAKTRKRRDSGLSSIDFEITLRRAVANHYDAEELVRELEKHADERRLMTQPYDGYAEKRETDRYQKRAQLVRAMWEFVKANAERLG